MYFKKRTQILLVSIIILLFIGPPLIAPVNDNNLNFTKGNTDQNLNNLITNLGNKDKDNASKISDTFGFLKEKLASFGQGEKNISVKNSETEDGETINKEMVIRAENETNVETMTFSIKMQKNNFAGPANENCDLFLTPDDIAHHSGYTFDRIIMGYQWGWWYEYKWEFKSAIKIWRWEIVLFRAYFEIGTGLQFQMHFPVKLQVDTPDIIEIGENNPVNLTLTAIDLKNPDDSEYNEFGFHTGLFLRAGVNILGGQVFSYVVDFGWDESQSYTTPLFPNVWEPSDPIELSLIKLAAAFAPKWAKDIMILIADKLIDAQIDIYPGIGSNLVTAQADLLGEGATIDGKTSLTLNWTQSPSTETFNLYPTEIGDMGISLSSFAIHLNHVVFKFKFSLNYGPLIEWITGDRSSLDLPTLYIATGTKELVVSSSQAVYIPMSITPAIYGAHLVSFIPSQQNVEPGTTSSYTLMLENNGTAIDSYELSVVNGIDRNWVTFFPQYLTLNPGETRPIEMIVYPPRDYNSTAGPYTFTINARSQGNESVNDNITGTVNVLPFYDVAARRTTYLSTIGVVNITDQDTSSVEFDIQNLGNIVEKFDMKIFSDLSAESFDYPSEVTILPGEITTVKVDITPDFVHSAYYEVILNCTSTDYPSIYDEGRIVINVLPTCDSIKYFINDMNTQLFNVPIEDWKQPALNLRKAMSNKLDDMVSTMSGCGTFYYEDAYDKLFHDIKPKLTGLKVDEANVTFGGGTFVNAWITDVLQQKMFENACNATLFDIKTLIRLST